MNSYIFKLIFRSWWRNKLFFIISVLSMAIGLACTTMLLAFVIYESNIENDNPEKEDILYMSQTFPMDTTKVVSYISGNMPQLIKDKYPEIKDCIRFQEIDVESYSIGHGTLSGITFISTDSSFSNFFPYQSIYGELSDVFKSPDKIALSESFAKQIFGDTYPIGQIINITPESNFFSKNKETGYEVVAILKDRVQSFISFDALTANPPSFQGGVSLLMTERKIDTHLLGKRLKADGVPTLLGDMGQYYFSTLQESYFNEYPNESIPYIKRQQKILLHTGWLAAILVLVIAGINYVNLSFSRLMEQVKLIKVQQLAGASPFQIGLQFFFDTFLTILIAFLLSILIVHDLTPIFNSIVSGRLSTSFFFSSQVLPYLIGLLILFSLLASLFMTYRLMNKPILISQPQVKQQTIRILSIVQYVISFALVIATITVNKQLNLIKKGGENYKGVIEVGGYDSNPDHIRLFREKAEKMPEIKSITTANTSIPYSPIRQLIIKQDNGEEYYTSMLEFYMDHNFIQTLSLELLQGLPPEEAQKIYASPVYINEEFLRILIPDNENPIGKPLVSFDKDYKERKKTDGENTVNSSVIAGIVSNLYTNSFEERVKAQAFHLDETANRYIQIRFEDLTSGLIEKLESIWKEIDPTSNFTYADVYQQFMERNKKVIGFSNLLTMYAVISLFLTAFGLFGIAYYATAQRIKEIGIRRVHGATSIQILLLLNKRFIYWICIAFLIAAPPVWILLHKWLQHYIYRTHITADIFLFAIIIVLGITLVAVSWHSYGAATRNPVESIKND